MSSNVRKERMPPEHLRRIIKVSKYNYPSFIGAMKYMPYALHNLLRSIPMPWESVKYVDVLYHTSGLITFVTDRKKVNLNEYKRRWSSLSMMFCRETERRGTIRELKYPVFDDDDPIVDYGSIIGLPIPKAIECAGNDMIFEDVEEEYMFDWKAFHISRVIGVRLDNGPYVRERRGKEVMVMGRQLGHERVKYPYLYNTRVSLSVLERQNMRLRCSTNRSMDMPKKSEVRHAVDIPLAKAWYLRELPEDGPKVRFLLRNYTRNMEKKCKGKAPTAILKELRNTRYFQRTEIDWVEAGLQLMYQGHRMLSEILKRKKLSYLVLDGNFNLKSLRPLTTKERKKSRVGTSYHLTREMLKFVKHIVDVHVLFRQGNIDSYELMNNVRYVFDNVGILTGMYRYKYKLMKQIKMCKDLRMLLEHKNVHLWAEQWRVWVSMFRGHIPLLNRYIGGLVTRIAEGRVYNPKPLSKQRSESGYDIAFKRSIVAEASSILQPVQIKRLLQHFNEAWRCWKANIPYHIVYEQAKGSELSKNQPVCPGAHLVADTASSIMDFRMIDRTQEIRQAFVSTLSSTSFSMELVENSMKMEHQTELLELQRIIDKYIRVKADWYIEGAIGGKERSRKLEKKRLGKITRLYMKNEMARQREYLKRPFLRPSEAVGIYKLSAEYFKSKNIKKISFPDRNEDKFLNIAVDRLRGTATPEELGFFEKALENSIESIFEIKKMFLTQRTFKDVGVALRAGDGNAIRSFHVSHMERLADAFLCSYLFYEADKLNVFPDFIKPGDELDTRLLMNFCERISEFKAEEGELLVLYEGKYKNLMENVDNNLLSKLLKLIMDPTLSDYIISRNNCQVFYKDMVYTNHVGYIKGFQFSPFVHKFYSFIIDLCVLGNDFFMDEGSNVKHYLRHVDDIYILFNFKHHEVDRLMSDYKRDLERIGKTDDGTRGNYFGNVVEDTDELLSFISAAGKLRERDRMVGNCVHVEMATRLPPSLGKIELRGHCVFPTLRFSMCGIDVLVSERKIHETSCWKLKSGKYANIAVSKGSIDRFNDRIAHILDTSGSATFLKVVNRWNTCILAFVGYYRESIYETDGLMGSLKKAECLIQNVVKKGINSKMPVRFPPAMFYSPREIGGLGMLSIGGIRVSHEDLRHEDDCAGDDRSIPMISEYVERWDVEFRESDRVWTEYGRNGKIELDKGIPRMNTLLQKNKIMFYDRGFRMISLYRKHSSPKPDPFEFTSTRHDGKLWSMDKFVLDVLDVLGGMESISEHTLFSATYFRSFSKVFWEETVIEKYKNLTNAQKMGMSQIPNRRFILWWSPTINRGNVYVGYQVQLELTGIFMHGKLPTLKVSFVQIFRGHLWKKIHESIVMDVCDVFKRYCDVRKMDVHNRKSYRFTNSSADILLSGNFYIHPPSSILEDEDGATKDTRNCKSLWIDVQLRWGDYDKRDSHKYAKVRFLECTTDPLTKYPSKDGFVVVLDLCYNTFSAYGNLNKELKSVVRNAMERIIVENITLHILRERLRKALQLYTSDVESVSSSPELFSSGLLTDSRFLLRKQRAIFIFDPTNGNLYSRSYDGENKKPRHVRSLAAQDIFSLGESLSKRSVVVAEDMIDAMENFVIDHPSISIKTSRSPLPFSNIMKIQGFDVKKSLQGLNLYEGWNVTSRFTNFCRLLLVIQGLEISESKVRELGICTIWPEFDDEEWIGKEIQLKDIIVEDYCSVNDADPSALSQNEVRDIVFGFKVHRDLGKEDVGKERCVSKIIPAANNISFTGDLWRTRYVTLDNRMRSGEHQRHITRILDSVAGLSYEVCNSLRVPLNLIEQFISSIDPQFLVCALMINTRPISFALVPQFSSELEIHSTCFVPNGTEDIVGVVVNSDRVDLIDVLAKRYRINRPLAIVIDEGVKAMERTDEWREVPLVADESPGVFYVPEMWNYNFSKPFYDDELVYTLRIGTPPRFYDGFSRVSHFSEFWCDEKED